MAGRGRGRGRGMSFSVESLGFGRGDSMPTPIQQPAPMFPPLELKAVPLQTGEEFDYLVALKQEFRGTMRESPYFIRPAEKKKDIDRYSDKYQLGQQDNSNNWQPDWGRLPAELKIRAKKRFKVKVAVRPSVASILRVSAKLPDEEIKKTLEELEKKEAVDGSDEEEQEAEKPDNEEGAEEEFFDEDDLEEETDYNLNYFDNGENFGHEEDDDLDDGPIY